MKNKTQFRSILVLLAICIYHFSGKSQMGTSTFSCCLNPNLNSIATFTMGAPVYSGNLATVIFTFNSLMTPNCAASAMYTSTFSFGDQSANAIVNPSSSSIISGNYSTTFTTSHTYTLPNVCPNITYTIAINVANEGGSFQCSKIYTINIVHPGSTYTISSSNSNCTTVGFSYSGLGSPASTQWIYGNGTSSSLMGSPGGTTYTYPAAGTYTAYLTGVGIAPCTVSTQINVQGPVSDFNYTVNNSCTGASSVALSILNYSTAGVTYNWQINSGAAVTASQNQTLTSGFSAGINTINLVVSNGVCSSIISKTVNISAVGNYSINYSISTCKTFVFSYSGSPAITNLQWAYGDGTYSQQYATGGNGLIHTYPSAGLYVVSLTGDGIEPCNLTQTVNVTDFMTPDYNYTVNNLCSAAGGLLLEIPNCSNAYTYQFQINNLYQNTICTGTYFGGLQNGNNVVKLTVTNSSGCTSSIIKNISIGAPVAAFSQYTNNVCIGDPLSTFNISAGGGAYSWTITNSTGSNIQTGMNPAYTFSSTGVYTIGLTITSTITSNGQTAVCSSSCMQTTTVSALPDASFSLTAVSCNNSTTLSLLNASSYTSYTVNYGDGTSLNGTYPIQNLHKNHTYASSPSNTVYVVSVVLQNAACQHSYTQNVVINNLTSLSIDADPGNFCAGSSLQISSQVNSTFNGVGPFTYSWTGPSGFTSSNQNITVSTGGNYSLSVASTGSCAITLNGTKSVTALAMPQATVGNITNITCTTTSGAATLTLLNNTVQPGYLVNGLAAMPGLGAGSTFTFAMSGLVQGNNNISVANPLNSSCAINLQINVTKTEPAVNLTVTQPVNCNPGAGSAAMSASPSGGTAKWFVLNNYPSGTFTTGSSVSGLQAGAYVLNYVDNNCIVNNYFNIVQPALNLSKVGGVATCTNATSALTINAQFIPQSVTGTYAYTMASTSSTVSGSSKAFSLAPGSYTAKVSANGCVAQLPFKIGILEPMNLSLNVAYPSCKDKGSVSAVCSGGDGMYTYKWYWAGAANGNTTSLQSLTTLSAQTTISVSAIDGSGCSATASGQSVSVSPPVPMALLSCGGIGNTNATNITACDISACLQGGAANYMFEWYKVGSAPQPVQWNFHYVGSVFVAEAGTTIVNVPIPSSSNNLSLTLNSDYSVTTVAYPFWNFTITPGTPVPVMNASGVLAGNPTSTVIGDYFSVLESVIIPGVSQFMGSVSGPSGVPMSHENFKTGVYQLKVTDALGCTASFSIGTLTFTETTTFHVAFQYVWGLNPLPKAAKDLDEDLAENMTEAADELLDQASKCAVIKTQQLKSYLFQDCRNLSNVKDQLTLTYTLDEQHHTLYYYDRAGRLTKTVPPQGVGYLSPSDVNLIKANRAASTSPSTWPSLTHSMATTYQYNAFGQLLSQNTPDGGTTNFIYDSKNRLRFSQNAKQLGENYYSYTKYDSLGRIIEVGESKLTGLNFSSLTATTNLANADLLTFPEATVSGAGNRQITSTVYSDLTSMNYYGSAQRFTQNRVSYTSVDPDPLVSGDEHYTYYSYDSHGNVEWMMTDEPGGAGQNYIAYEYDLVSGKVLKVKYNEKRADRFFHRYQYDAENRLVLTETSRNGELWDKDASYSYYAHGPLKRTVLGEDKVQGLDYIYTIHGWIKSINSPNLSTASDPGSDNSTAGGGSPLARVAADRHGMILNYYTGDYVTNGSNFLTANTQYNLSAYNATNGAAPSLYNGNISGWIQSQLNSTASNTIDARADLFQYDVLNRIKQSTSVRENTGNNSWQNLAGGATTFKTEYSYDRNGNILNLKRNDDAAAAMDDLRYTYDNGAMGAAKNSNRLTSVQDVITTTVTGRQDLISTHNYTYDAIGNLTRETGQEMLAVGNAVTPSITNFTTEIAWNVYGKISEIKKYLQGTSHVFRERITFYYDAAGNRVRKEYWKDSNTSPDDVEQGNEMTVTYYVRDAQGNTMANYQKHYDANASLYKLDLIEQPIYGSDRVGQNSEVVTLAASANYNSLVMPGNGAGIISEYQNWITTTNKSSLLPVSGGGNNDNLCQCKVLLMTNTNNNPNYNAVQGSVDMLGIAGNGVAVAEDLTRSMQFYVVLSKNYLGSRDACLVFDKNGRLMAGSEMIGTMDTESKPVIVQLPNTSQYAIVTLSATTKQAVYHIVDMSQLGYGPVVNSGSVISVNNILDQSMNGALHGYHFTGVEDHINGHAIVYGTKFKTDANDPTKGTTAVMAYDFGTATLSPVASTLNSVYGCGNTERGELQISPEGNKLTWWRYDKNLAGFAHRTGELRTMPLNAARTGLNGSIAVRAISNAGSYGNGMFDFMKNNKDIFYSQRGLYQEGVGTTQYDRNVWKYEPVNLTSLAINPFSSPQVTYLFGEVKRGIDGNYYIPNMGRANDQIHSYSGTNFNSYSYGPDTTYKLASALPTQVFKIFDNATTLKDIVRSVGNKDYELKDHLGNVRVVISDAKLIEDADMSLTVSANDLFKPEVKNYTDYYAFGMVMPSRSFNGGDYRYGFNGKENDNEVKGSCGSIDFGERIYDARIGRFLSLDPLARNFSHFTPYGYAFDRPNDGRDEDGNGWLPVNWRFWESKEVQAARSFADIIGGTIEKVDKHHAIVRINDQNYSFWYIKALTLQQMNKDGANVDYNLENVDINMGTAILDRITTFHFNSSNYTSYFKIVNVLEAGGPDFGVGILVDGEITTFFLPATIEGNQNLNKLDFDAISLTAAQNLTDNFGRTIKKSEDWDPDAEDSELKALERKLGGKGNTGTSTRTNTKGQEKDIGQQEEEITRAQTKLRQKGKGAAIESTKKSKQRRQNDSEDVKNEHNNK